MQFGVPFASVRALGAVLGLALAAALPARAAAQETGEYATLDNVEGSYVPLATFPVRPMVLAPDGALWAVNHHDNTVVRFPSGSTTGTSYQVAFGPGSIAYWGGQNAGTTDDDEVIVVCRNTWAILCLNAHDSSQGFRGEVRRAFELRPLASDPNPDMAALGKMAEPGDIVVLPSHKALVSCAGADRVLQINLPTLAVEHIYHESNSGTGPGFRLKHPLFLSTTSDGKVLVAPMISGNNSGSAGSGTLGRTVVDLSGSATPLPDQDLFRIDPVAMSVEPVVKAAGTILFGHGINPATGLHWQLNLELLNKNNSGEPALKGVFGQNRITRVALPLPGAGEVTPTLAPIGLDAASVGPIGQPNGIAFTPAPWGQAFVTGALTDNVAMLSNAGVHIGTFAIPPIAGGNRAIPRAVLVKTATDSRHGTVLVYCWGDNSIREAAYDLTTVPPTFTVASTPYLLGYDPTTQTPAVRRGRNIFFDARNSLNGNLSCASCHIEGMSDLLNWNLSNLPIESKGVTLTQTLVGLARLQPFHWRGERQLIDFNPAFNGLLGMVPPPSNPNQVGLAPADLQDFVAFMSALTNPANPSQNRERVLDPNIHIVTSTPHTPGDAVEGQDAFLNDLTFQGNTHRCADCHDQPTGTLNDIVDETPGAGRVREGHMKPAPFHELWRRQQSLLPGSGSLPYLGAGFAHSSFFSDLFDFVVGVAGSSEADIADAIFQWDSGVAPACHFSFHLDAQTASLAQQELVDYLQVQAELRNCDIAVFGRVRNSLGALVFQRWFWDRNQSGPSGPGMYRCEDPAIADRTLDDFLLHANLAAGERNTFVGTLVGSARRAMVDHDLDGFFNALDSNDDDPAVPTPPTGQPPQILAPGVNAQWISTKVARLRFDTNEPTRVQLRYGRVGVGDPDTVIDLEPYSHEHSVLLSDLLPSTDIPPVGLSSVAMNYDVRVTVFDRAGESDFEDLTVRTDPFIEPTAFNPNNLNHVQRVNEVVVDELSALHVHTLPTGELEATVTVRVAFKRGGDIDAQGELARFPAAGRAVIGRVLVRAPSGAVSEPTTTNPLVAGTGTKRIAGANLSESSAPPLTFANVTSSNSLLVNTALTDVNGSATLVYRLPTAYAGHGVVFNVEAVVQPTDATAWAAALALCSGAGCTLVVPVPAGQVMAWSQWSFPDTKEAKSAIEKPY